MWREDGKICFGIDQQRGVANLSNRNFFYVRRKKIFFRIMRGRFERSGAGLKTNWAGWFPMFPLVCLQEPGKRSWRDRKRVHDNNESTERFEIWYIITIYHIFVLWRMWKTYPQNVEKWTYPDDISLLCEKIYQPLSVVTAGMSTKKLVPLLVWKVWKTYPQSLWKTHVSCWYICGCGECGKLIHIKCGKLSHEPWISP